LEIKLSAIEGRVSLCRAALAGCERLIIEAGKPLAWSLLVLAASAQAQTVDLLCRAKIDGRPALVEVIRLDYAQKTANGYRAKFTDTEISWATVSTEHGQTWRNEHTLNRVAGTYRAVTRATYGVPPLYSCEEAPPAKF
jgi:hypothetical protein